MRRKYDRVRLCGNENQESLSIAAENSRVCGPNKKSPLSTALAFREGNIFLSEAVLQKDMRYERLPERRTAIEELL